MFDYLWTRRENKTIFVDIDPLLATSISQYGRVVLADRHRIRVPVNLFRLILAIGTIHTNRLIPTNRQKFYDKCALLKTLRRDSNVFMIRRHPDAHIQGEISEDLGLGLAVVIADYFYKLQWSTLAKIRIAGRESKPDIKCFSSSNQALVLEAKGTIDEYTRNSKQRPTALNQKRTAHADIQIASCALLKDSSTSEVDFLDPAAIPLNDKKYHKRLLMADHYTRVFNFIGQKELSNYYNLMRKRIIHDTEFEEYPKKEKLFRKIKKGYIRIKKRGHNFLGNLEKINEKEFIFVGIDEHLISLQGFLDFQDYNDDYNFEEGKNVFNIMSDGICFAKIKDTSFIKEQLLDKEIHHYQEEVSIADLDMMNYIALNEFVEYLFRKIGCKITEEMVSKFKKFYGKIMFDQIIEYKNKKIIVEIKKSLRMKGKGIINQLCAYQEELKPYKILLITLDEVSRHLFDYAIKSKIFVIDRRELKKIIKNNEVLLKYLK